ncbi:MAG: rhodanese-like domain-containing protein [Deltaproteobacteria bacterium]|nr:rhodanese-like domain-containing protein [Deltaproteobacteria bacterium]
MSKKTFLVVLAVSLLWCWALPLGAQGDKPAVAPPAEKPAVAATVAPKAAPEIPKDKQTTPGLYVTSKEAYDLWQKDQQKVKIIDCRTPEEYAFVGHAPMAVNIPSKFMTYDWDAKKKEYAMKVNPNFVKEIQKRFAKDDIILVTCRSGQRSAASVNLLAKAGFTKVYSIIDGFEGDKVKDPQSPNKGKRMKDGWKISNLPWTYDLDVDLIYLPKGKPKAK